MQAVLDAKSEEIGPGIYRFKAEIGEFVGPAFESGPVGGYHHRARSHWCFSPSEFKGERLVQRHMDRLGGVERLHEQIYSAVMTKRRESLDLALMAYGELLLPSS